MNNYIKDLNPFNLAGPPSWWLKQLWHFDSSLVVVPSRQGFFYRLAQRRKLNPSVKIVNEALAAQGDTLMLSSYSLIPVTTILSTANWSNPYLFEELRQRAPWRLGGADKVNADLEAADAARDIDKATKIDEHLTYLGKDAWRFYNMKLGLRSHLYSPTTKTSRPTSGAPALKVDQRPSQSPNPQHGGAESGSQRPVSTIWVP